MTRAARSALLLACGLALCAGPVRANTADVRPPELRDVGIDQRLNEQVPLDLTFRNEAGETVTIGSLLRGKPVVLSLVYYECPMLCTLVLNGMLSTLRALPFTAGNEFDIITVSFDPRDTPELAARKKANYLAEYRRPGAEQGWHFLTGDEATIKRLAEAVGFRYTYLPEKGEFAHAAGIMVLTPRGILARYFYGVEFAPRDVKFGLMEAAENRIGSPVDQLMLFCFSYDPSTGRYTNVVLNAVRIGGIATVLAFALFVYRTWRRDRGAPRNAATPPPVTATGPGGQ